MSDKKADMVEAKSMYNPNQLHILFQQGNITLEEYNQELQKRIAQESSVHERNVLTPSLSSSIESLSSSSLAPCPNPQANFQHSKTMESDVSHLSFDELPLELPSKTSTDPGRTTQTSGLLPLQKGSQSITATPFVSSSRTTAHISTKSSDHIFQARYRIKKKLSSAHSTSDVQSCLAQDLLLQEKCVLKIAGTHTTKTSGARSRFLAQYHLQRSLRHPQLAQVYHLDYQPNQGILYTLMEYVQGTSVAQYIQMQSAVKALPFSAQNITFLLQFFVDFLEEWPAEKRQPIWLHSNDIIWSPKHPNTKPKILRLRLFTDFQSEASMRPVQAADEVLSMGLLLRNMLMGSLAATDKSPSQTNPTVPLGIDKVLACATHPQPSERYLTLRAFLQAYLTALHTTQEPSPTIHTPIPQLLSAELKFQAHISGIIAVSSDKKGQALLTAGRDHQLKWWDTTTWSAIYSLTVDDASLACAALSPCGHLVVFCKTSHHVEVRYAGSPTPLCILQHRSPVQKILWGHTANCILTATSNGSIHIWEIPSSTITTSWNPNNSKVIDLQLSPEGRLLASLHEEYSIHFWSLENKQWLFDLPASESPALQMTFMQPSIEEPNRSLLFTGHADGSILGWDYQTGLQVLHIKAHNTAIHSLTSSSDAKWLLSSDNRGESILWPLKKKNQIGAPLKLKRTGRSISSACFFPNSPFFVTSTKESQLELWKPPE